MSDESNELNDFRRNWQDEVLVKKTLGLSLTDSEHPLQLLSSNHNSGTVIEHEAFPNQEEDKRSIQSNLKSKSPEPSPKKKSTPSKALDLYIKATQHERMGELGEALSLYRRAIKLDENVEDEFRTQIQDYQKDDSPIKKEVPVEKDANEAFYTYYNFIDDQKTNKQHTSATTDEFREYLQEIKSESPTFIQKSEVKICILNTLPNELLISCMKWACLLDIQNLISLSLVSKKMLLLTRDTTLWSFLCRQVFPLKSLLDTQIKIYANDWFTMYIQKSRIKWHGVYISRINYQRQGYGENFNQPIHLITYYRYYRFYKDGSVVSVTSTIAPIIMVKQINNTTHSIKGIMHGSYSADSTDTLHVTLNDSKRPKTIFKSTLKLSCAKQGRHNKLMWIEYYSQNGLIKSEIPLSTLKPFQFSKVKSYILESTLMLT